MTMRKAFAAAALVLVVAILSPVAAIAQTKGADRPVKGVGTGAISVDIATGGFTAEIVGHVGHLGLVTVHAEGAGMPTADGRFVGTGTATIVTANGDELTGTLTLSTSELLPSGHTTTVVITVTGGSGRFADAAGTLTVVCDVVPQSQSGTVVVSHLECTVQGRISY
jgi:hypothetical protein